LYRFYLVKKGNPLCKLYYKKHPNRTDESYCVASQKITKLKSRYSYFAHREEKVIPFILKMTSYITDIQTGEKIAQATTFMQYAGWMHYLFHGPTLGTHYPNTSIHYTVLYKTLQAKK